ncbi:hypothetical protein A6U87_17450 [Rhizobium sp. AC44/96]|uniref:hypothetical protein n=1 Tax=Rhizobium sp. AC44/96 TaxID=1841654 RepID=UPI00080FEDE0|nr:hypothetical protein [Rhizobium sp. AC44/96]OCJ03723.1 hypothetical protein A6U87_17450 [Rhizobium sp. AC44/96]
MNQYVTDIDEALRPLDLRRTAVPEVGVQDQAMEKLASIQASLSNLVKARDQEVQLGNGKSILDAVSQS